MVSNRVSNAGYPPASATPPLGDNVFRPDQRLGERNRKLTSMVNNFAIVDCFDWTGGGSGHE